MKEIVIAIIGSGALSAIISAVTNALANKKNSDKALQMLLLGEIKRQGKEYLQAGEITMDDFEAFNETYAIYKKKGGNGFADGIKAHIDKLPIKP